MQKKIMISAWGVPLSESSGRYQNALKNCLNNSNDLSLESEITEATNLYLALEHDAKSLKILRKKTPNAKSFLVVFEPECVSPRSHSQKIRKLYDVVIIISPEFRNSSREIYWRNGHIAESDRTLATSYAADRPRLPATEIAIVNENKFSAISGELYSFRRSAIRALASTGWGMHVYGRNWTRNRFWETLKILHALLIALSGRKLISSGVFHLQNLRKILNVHLHGGVESVIKTLADFEFALVIENQSNYLSEKIFNALLAGCIPIYNGPELDSYGIPSNVYLRLQSLDPPSLAKFLGLTEAERQQMRHAGRIWINSPDVVKQWGLESSCQELINLVSSQP